MNRKLSLFTLALLALVTFGCTRNTRDAKPSPSPTPVNLTPIAVPSPVIGKPYPGRGVVKFINKKEGWIEIDHEEIKDLMPPMIMEWTLKKPAQLNTVKVGDKVEFIVVETGKAQIITDIKKAK
jgi:Cu/Ag efflux protein CusF